MECLLLDRSELREGLDPRPLENIRGTVSESIQ